MRDDPPGACIILREGHWPKMFLWMIEEYAFILSQLRVDDHNGELAWVMNFCSSRVAGAAGREGKGEDHAALAYNP